MAGFGCHGDKGDLSKGEGELIKMKIRQQVKKKKKKSGKKL